jgi:ADP-ribosyl-[dinitrogen reductase] hydrolase
MRVKAGEPWDEAVEAVQREHPESAGNGSLMRCWPVAIAHWHATDDLLIDSWRQSRVTHPHPDCLTACSFVNALIHNLLQGMPPDVALTVTGTMVRTSEVFFKRVFNAAYKDRDDLANTGWVMDTLESAVWGLVNTATFEEAVISVVNLGSDADTAGAVVGALAGARYGLSSIPQRWRDALRGEWPVNSGTVIDASDLIAPADRLARGGIENLS